MKTSFAKTVHEVLHELGYQKTNQALEYLIDEVQNNRKLARNKVTFYKWPGWILLTAIPLASALLSVLVGADPSKLIDSKELVAPLSLGLTLFTILNTVFGPGKRFSEACHIEIRIERFIVEFLVDLQRLGKTHDAQSPEFESALLDLVVKKRKDLEQYQIELIGMFMPMEMSARHVATGTHT